MCWIGLTNVNVPHDKKSSKKPSSLANALVNKLGFDIITGSASAGPSGIATDSHTDSS